jgi:uncharacterized UBP type Zn finger protein
MLEIYRDISLNMSDGTQNLDGLLTNHFSDEDVDYNCSNCNSNSAILKYRFEKLPTVLVLHLKRFQLDNRGNVSKRKESVGIPETIDISRFTIDRTAMMKYELTGIISHLGKSQMHGHYIFDRNIHGSWTSYNDALVTEGLQDMPQQRASDGYIFTFTKIGS